MTASVRSSTPDLFPGTSARTAGESFHETVIRHRMERRGMTHAEALDSLINDIKWGKHGGPKAAPVIQEQCRLIAADAGELAAAQPAMGEKLQRIIDAANRIRELAI